MENKNNLIFTTNDNVENSLIQYGIVPSSDKANLRFLNGEYPNGTIVSLNDRYYLPIFTNNDREVIDITYAFENYM